MSHSQETHTVSLRAISHIYAGGTPDKKTTRYWENGSIPWVNSGTVNQGLVTRPSAFISEEAFENSSTSWARKGDLIVALAGQGQTKGKIAQMGMDACVNQSMAVIHIRETSNFVPRFAYYAIHSQYRDIRFMAGGDKRDGLNLQHIGAIRIPYPPFDTQRRIADYLDRETAEIDGAVADLDKYVELLEKRRRALVHETLVLRKGPGSGLSIGDSQRGRVGFVTRLLRRGISPSYVDEGVPVINQKCVRTGGFLDIASCRFHDSGARNIGLDLTIQPGDTLINSTGTGTLGRSCTVGEISVPTTWDSHVTLVRPNIDIADPGYLGWTILSQESKLVEFSTGSTNQIELSRDTIFNLDFVSIPLDLQKEVSAYLNRETAEIDSLIADSTRLRDLLLKRRSVLITEVVTGRKQV